MRKNETIQSFLTGIVTVILSAGVTSFTVAQVPEEKNRGTILEEIVVTASKRAQNLQDVAFSLSALSGDDLKRVGAVSSEDYIAQIPGVAYNSLGRGRSPIIIRGISAESDTINDQQKTIGFYIDELPSLQRWGAWTNTDLSTYDIERIEVLRGPQGTLFGSGALGGAVRIINNKPDASAFAANFEFSQAFTKGGDDSTGVNGMINIPLIEDELALRIVGYTRSDGGYIDNTARNEKNVNDTKAEGGRLMLSYTPTENLNMRFTLTHQDDEVDDDPAGFQNRADGGPYEYNRASPAVSDISMTVYNLVAEYDFDSLPLLGPATLTSSTTYADRDNEITIGLDSLVTLFLADTIETDFVTDDVHTFAQELRLTSQGDGPLEWTIGGFYLNQDIDTVQLVTSTATGLLIDGLFLADVRERAVFGEASYHFTDKISLTAGGRYFDNSFRFATPVFSGAFIGGSFPTPSITEKSSKFTPKVSASYHPTEDIHLYATIAQGFRVGQVNFGATPANGIPLTFKPDTLLNYEIGMKSHWLDGRLKANMSVFYIDWSDIQVNSEVIQPGNAVASFNLNAGDASSKGFEAEFTYLPAEGWELGSALSYSHAELDSVEPGVLLTPDSDLPGAPDFTASNYVQYTNNSLPYNMSGYLRFGHRYVGEMVSNIDNLNSLRSDKYHTFNLRAGLYFDRYELAFYVDNLTNNDAVTSRPDLDFQDIITFRAYRLRPRTAGLTIRADF